MLYKFLFLYMAKPYSNHVETPNSKTLDYTQINVQKVCTDICTLAFATETYLLHRVIQIAMETYPYHHTIQVFLITDPTP